MPQDGVSRSDEPPPPWVALPDLSPEDPATQGAADAYVTLTFFPFWAELSAHEKADFLDRWDASAEWRAVISERYDHEGLDLEAEAQEAEAWRAAHLASRSAKPWWRFWRR